MKTFCLMALLSIFALNTTPVFAATPSVSASAKSVTEADASGGIKEALALGVKRSIARLGKTDGFFGDQLVRIAMPKKVRRLADAARALGANAQVDAFELSLNRAAEKAMPLAADVFADAVRQMTVQDAFAIVRGDSDAGTQFFRRVTEEKLREKFLPVVSRATSEVGVTQRYKELTAKSAISKLLGDRQDINLDQYVTEKSLDGLYYYIGEEEKSIRKNPLQQGTNLLRRVFGGK
jgi:Protein of unknown function (DUF4197)